MDNQRIISWLLFDFYELSIVNRWLICLILLVNDMIDVTD